MLTNRPTDESVDDDCWEKAEEESALFWLTRKEGDHLGGGFCPPFTLSTASSFSTRTYHFPGSHLSSLILLEQRKSDQSAVKGGLVPRVSGATSLS